MSGGPYQYLREAFGPLRFGAFASFLFLWQTMLIGPISIASGAVGFAQYARYLVPGLHGWQMPMLAALVCITNMLLLLRRITSINFLSVVIASIVIATTAWIVISGTLHFHPAMAFDFPPGAFHLTRQFSMGLGAATLIAVYDYGGYNNICLIGEEVRNPRKTIPQSILISIALVAALYLTMNIAILGVIPWREAMHSDAIVALFIERIYGPLGAKISSVLILIATFGSVFAILLGFSRVPYAAAADGHFFSIFARLHPKQHYPIVAVVSLGLLSALACLLSLGQLINLLIVVQILLQFMAQCIAVIVLRKRVRHSPASFRMPFFPLPALIALAGWTYVVVTSGIRYIEIGLALMLLGVLAFLGSILWSSSVALQSSVNKTWDVAVAGEVYADHIFSGFDRWPLPGEEHFTDHYVREAGGGATITACGLARLRRNTAIFAVMGEQDYWIRRRLSDFGVHLENLRQVATATAVTVSISTREDRSFLTWPGANRDLASYLQEPETQHRLAQARHVHLALPLSRDLAIELIPRLHSAGCTISLDTGHHPEWLQNKANWLTCGEVDFFLPNELEAQIITASGDSHQLLHDVVKKGIGNLVIKLGSRGATAMLDGEIYNAQARPANVVDTTGAGDAFDAGLIDALLDHASPSEMLDRACLCGSLSTRQAGALTALPNREELISIS